MKPNSTELWASFRRAFLDAANETNFQDFGNAWKSCKNRTEFYFNILLPNIASRLSMSYEKEKFFHIDAVFCREGGQTTKIPFIALESENHVKTSDNEIKKLCMLNTPVKILMICNTWNDSTKEKMKDNYWDYIIGDFHDQVGLIGVLAVIIGEWDDYENELKFYTHVYDETAEVIEDAILLTKK